MCPSLDPPGHTTLVVKAKRGGGSFEHEHQLPLGWYGMTMGPDIGPRLHRNNHPLNRLVVGIVNQVMCAAPRRFLSLLAEFFEKGVVDMLHGGMFLRGKAQS